MTTGTTQPPQHTATATTTTTTISNGNILFTLKYAVWIGLFVRLFLAWFLPWMMDQNPAVGVDYTDIDFHVFSDAARYIQQNQSPYQRATYRYTPFLAYGLSKLPHAEFGRVLICVADTICGAIIWLYRRNHRNRQYATGEKDSTSAHFLQHDPQLLQRQQRDDALWWLYNPLAIHICTRGSAESLVVLLPVLSTVWLTCSLHDSSTTTTAWSVRWYGTAVLAGICHGVAIHAKLYPIIYTLSFMTQFVTVQPNRDRPKNRSILSTCLHVLQLWIRRILSCPAALLFGASTVISFGIITYVAVLWYGNDAITEGLLYHFARVDHRHNYSMHWYWIYLLRDRIASSSPSSPLSLAPSLSSFMATFGSSGVGIHPQMLTKIIGIVLLVPQMMLLLYASIGIAPSSLSLALFVQTFLFVAHNKVITAQYFTWYLCLLPLCSDQFRLTQRVKYALLFLGVSILFWLSSAYCLEMQGMAVHQVVWMASLLFFVANLNLFGALLSTTAELQRRHQQQGTVDEKQKVKVT